MRRSALLAIALVAGCRTAAPHAQPDVRPASVPASSPGATAVPADTTLRPRHTPADARFMQGMIAHHSQALAMTALIPGRTTRPEMRLLAERIDVSQRDEIALMQQWLARRGERAPAAGGGHAGHGAAGHAMTPSHGMLTEAEMTRLAAARDTEFDRLFLQFMIRHHEGALTMVRELFGTPGAAQETETYRFATDVDADQRAEIARMRALLQSLPPSR